MYSILTTASHNDREWDDLPQATDPAIFGHLSKECDVPVPLQQPLTLLIGPLSLQRDYLTVANTASGNLCSQRFIDVLASASVPFRAYPTLLLDVATHQTLPDRYCLWFPHRIDGKQIIDLQRSEVRLNPHMGYHQFTSLVLKAECEASLPLLFQTAGKLLIHETLRHTFETIGITGVEFGSLHYAGSTGGGIKILEIQYQLQEDPDNRELWQKLGKSLLSIHKYAEALQAMEHAVTLQPDRSDAWYLRGRVLQAMGRLPEALESLKQAVERDPESWAWQEYTQVLRELGRYEEALASAEHLVQLKNIDFSWRELGLSHAALGHTQEALEAFEQGWKKGGGGLPEIPRGVGDMLYQLGRYEEALEAYERGLHGNKLSIASIALWEGKVKTLRVLGRIKMAEAAEQEIQRMEQVHASVVKQNSIW
ncbi:MAG: tetratricopeptide repeat protein [Ktedonobacteraceae bacterium]